MCGVKKGIERLTKVAMPILLLLILFCNFHTIRLEGFLEEISFLLTPDFSKINSAILLSALGLSFFKLSIGMCTLVTYGSYFIDDNNLIGTAAKVVFSDLIVSLLIGLIVFRNARCRNFINCAVLFTCEHSDTFYICFFSSCEFANNASCCRARGIKAFFYGRT